MNLDGADKYILVWYVVYDTLDLRSKAKFRAFRQIRLCLFLKKIPFLINGNLPCHLIYTIDLYVVNKDFLKFLNT